MTIFQWAVLITVWAILVGFVALVLMVFFWLLQVNRKSMADSKETRQRVRDAIDSHDPVWKSSKTTTRTERGG